MFPLSVSTRPLLPKGVFLTWLSLTFSRACHRWSRGNLGLGLEVESNRTREQNPVTVTSLRPITLTSS